MKAYDIVIVGGGPAGLAAAASARNNGAESILVLERDKELGGILNQCIHNGFGLHTFKEELTGPDYAARFIEQVKALNIEYRLNTMVMDISNDKVVTCMIFKDDPEITMFDLNKKNVGGADVYGLLPDDDIHLNGWFSDYIYIRGGAFGSTFFNVSDLDLDSRILIEPCAVLIHAVERAKSTGILRFNSRVVVQGCGPIGLICIAILRTMGIENICAVDGEQKRLDFAKKMGADMSVNFKDHKGIEALTGAVKDAFGGHLADFAFQCTGSPVAHANIYKFIRNGGGLCELGFFINGGDATINPHFDICSKEITTVGSWVYTLRDYVTTFDFLKRAKAIGLPMSDLITDRFPLEQINEAHQTNLAMTGLKIAIINK